MYEITRIADQMRRAFDGQAWHGPAVREILANIAPDTAARKPIANAHSIWELVLHMRAWKNGAHRMLQGEVVNLTPEEDFPAPSGDWSAAVEGLTEAHARLLSTVEALSDDRLSERVQGRDYNVYFLLHGIIQHDLYHAGQIAVLKKG
jgi:uncharacterized damage-inducible protein DinB